MAEVDFATWLEGAVEFLEDEILSSGVRFSQAVDVQTP